MIIPVLLLLSLPGSTQVPLPFHTAGPDATLLLGDKVESFTGQERSLREVTSVGPEGVMVQRVRQFKRYTPAGDSSAWHTHLAARLDRPVQAGTLYFEGIVPGIEPFIADARTVHFWQSDTLEPMIRVGGRDLRYIWRMDESGDRTLVLHELNYNYMPREVTSYHIKRSGCRAEQNDSVAVIHCLPDEGHLASEPAFVFVMVNGQPVHVWRERADAKEDTTVRHRLLATLAQDSERALLFSTGEVLAYKPHRWKWKGRDAIKNYIEQAAGEQQAGMQRIP